MELKWLLISSEGNLDRKGFWITILTLNFFSLILDEIGNSIFLDIGQDKISFFIAKKRINDIGSSEWVPIAYVISLFLPSFLLAAGPSNLYIISIILPILITFYLGLAPSRKK